MNRKNSGFIPGLNDDKNTQKLNNLKQTGLINIVKPFKIIYYDEGKTDECSLYD
jgi:hypothetical protein